MSACAPAGTLLGQTTEYVDTYRPDLLTPIPRSLGRDAAFPSPPPAKSACPRRAPAL